VEALFPRELRHPDQRPAFLAWLSSLPIDPQDKKQLALDWASLVGVHFTADELRAAIPGLARDEGA
jgi:hypothetical protein